MHHLVIILLLCTAEAIQVSRKTKPYSKNIRNVRTISYRSMAALIAKKLRRKQSFQYTLKIASSFGILLKIECFTSVYFVQIRNSETRIFLIFGAMFKNLF